MIKTRNLFAACLAAILGSLTAIAQAEPSPTIKLYTLDCGTVTMLDMAGLADDGSMAGKSMALADPCFLIRHPKGDFLWDTGLTQSLADVPGGVTYALHVEAVTVKLTDQLAALGLVPSDIDYTAFSHWHPDHSGNAGLFAASTFIVHEKEHAFIFSDTVRASSEIFAFFAPLEGAKTVLFRDTHDVFGDGSAVIHAMPGHTDGHAVLELNLPEAGTLLLTGDLYVYAGGRQTRAVPVFATSRQELLQSMDRFEALAAKTKARVIIQHDPSHFGALPQFPDYLE